MSATPVCILGISAYYHDSAAALLRDGVIVAAAHEERFSRQKHDANFPAQAVRYVLEEAAVELHEVAGIAFYDKPFLKFERLLETYHALAPRGLVSFLTSMPVWIKEKIFMRSLLERALRPLLAPGAKLPPLYFPEHHLSHAASAFYPSPFEEAAILTIDGVGEWVTTSLSRGRGNSIESLREIHFPHSLGLLYSAFTAYCGFKVNSGEYKLMGLAPYGNPEMQKRLNLKIKYREGFRPFAPSVLEEYTGECFELEKSSPYMLLVAPVAERLREPLPEGYRELPLWERLYSRRSALPAVTHVDYSARVQSIRRETNPRYWRLVETFRERHGCPVVVTRASTCGVSLWCAALRTRICASCARRWTIWCWGTWC